MEFRTPFLSILGAIVGLFWLIDFLYLFKRPEILIPSFGRKTSWSALFRGFIGILGFTGWCYLSYSLAQPRLPTSIQNQDIEVNDIYLVVDVSRSMLAEDFQPNRIEVAKNKIVEFVDFLPQDRIGIVSFSDDVFTLLPLTTDHDLVKSSVRQISVGPLGAGTSIGDAIALATIRIVQSEAKNKVIILLTDGVSNSDNIPPLQAAEEAKKYGIKVYSIAIGSNEDARLPVGKTIFGNQYQMIPGGSFDLETLKKISKLTGGKAYLASSDQALREVFMEIGNLERTKIKKLGQVVYKELYYKYFFIGIILLFCCEFFRKLVIKEWA